MSYLRQVACYACEAIGAAAVLWRPSADEEASFHIAGWDKRDFMQGEQDPYCSSLSDESKCHWANWNKFIRSKAGAQPGVYPFMADLEPYNSATFSRVNTTFITQSPETLFFHKHEDIVYWSWLFALEKSSESICYKPCGRPEPTPEPSPEPEPSRSPEPPTPVTPTPSPDPPGKMKLTLTGIKLSQDVSSFMFSKVKGSTADGSYAQLLFTMVGKREDNAFAVIGITIKDPSLTAGANNIQFKLGQPTSEGIECEIKVNGKEKRAFVSGMGYFPEFEETIEIDGIMIGKEFKNIEVWVTPEDKDRRTFLGWAQDITPDKVDFICVKDGAIIDKTSTPNCSAGATKYNYVMSKGTINVIDLDTEAGTAAIPFTSYIRPYLNTNEDIYSWGNTQFKESTTDPYDSLISGLKNTNTNEWLISSKDTAAFDTSNQFDIQCNTTIKGYTNTIGNSTIGFIGTVSDEKITMFQGIWGTCNPSENKRQTHPAGDFVEFEVDGSGGNIIYSFVTYGNEGEKTVHAAGIMNAQTSPGLPMLEVERTYAAGKDTYNRKLRYTRSRSDTSSPTWIYNKPFADLYTGITYPLGPIKTKIYDEGMKRYRELQEIKIDDLINAGIHEVELNVNWSKIDMVYVATPVDRDDYSKFVAAGIYVNSTYSETAFVDIVAGDIMQNDQNKIKTTIDQYKNIGTSLAFKQAKDRHNTWMSDEFHVSGADTPQELRAMTFQNYDKRHPAVLINPTEAFVEPLRTIGTSGSPFKYSEFMIVVVKNGTSTEGATQREDTNVERTVNCADSYTIFGFKASGADKFALGNENPTIGSVHDMLMERVKKITEDSESTDGKWFTSPTYTGAVDLNNGADSIASPWRSWEPLGISYSIWDTKTWVNHPAFIMRARMAQGYIGCLLVLAESMDAEARVIPFKPVEFSMDNTTEGTHEFNAWPMVQFTKSYMVTGGNGVIYNLLNGGQPAGTLADILFFNMTEGTLFATVVDHKDHNKQYAYLRLENIPWNRGTLSKGDLIGTSMMATTVNGKKQFAGTIIGLIGGNMARRNRSMISNKWML